MRKLTKIISAAVLIVILCLIVTHVAYSGVQPIDPGEFNLPNKPVKDILTDFAIWLLTFVSVAAIIAVVIGGFMYMASGGNEQKTEQAKKIILYAVIGEAVILASWMIVKTIAGFIES